MTPPDSGETMCDCGKHVDGDEFALPAGGHVRAAHQRKPDSGEREVLCLHGLAWPCSAHGPLVHLPLPLAQRILAAVEEHAAGWPEPNRYTDLASELRAAVERKP